MTQRDLNRAVARATGESVQEINRRGFGPLDSAVAEDEGPHRLIACERTGRQPVGTASSQQRAAAIAF